MRPKDLMTDTLLTHKEIVGICKKIAKWIDKEYKGRNPLLVGLLRGCFPFMAELIKHIKVDFEIDFMTAKSYRGEKSTLNLNIIHDLSTDIKDRNILVVEDIVDTGYTLTQINKLFNSRGVKSLEVVTLLNKKEARKYPVKIAKSGLEISNQFVVGFGLDYNEQYRGINHIGIMNPKYIGKEVK